MNWADLKDAATGTAAAPVPPPSHFRSSAQIRADDPAPSAAPSAIAIRMADLMREIVHRDGHVTEKSLMIEGGFSAADLIEHRPEAMRLAQLVMTIPGKAGLKPGEIAEKCMNPAEWMMPLPAGTESSADMKCAWIDYCKASQAHRLDPWISQRERTLSKLRGFLERLPLLPREVNGIVTTLAMHLHRRESA